VSLGIRFLSPTESIDTGTDSPMSKFLLHLFAAFAEMEREIIRERVFRRDEIVRLRCQGMSGENSQTLNLPMSTVIDAGAVPKTHPGIGPPMVANTSPYIAVT
jgi:hypothetical protein